MKRLTLAAVSAVALALTGFGIAPANAATATTGHVTVKVTAVGGGLIENAWIELEGDTAGAYGSTNASGTYTTDELAPGTYDLTTRLSYPVTAEATQKVVVTANKDTAVVVALAGVQVLTGKVTANSKNISNAWVIATSSTNSYSAKTTNGSYSLVAPAGQYTVEVNEDWSAPTARFLTTFAGNTVREVDAKTVRIAPSSTATLNIAAYAKIGSIKGAVVDAKGKPVAGASVSAYGSNRTGWAFATTDAKGSYTLTGLPAGRYSVHARKGSLESEYMSPRIYTVKTGRTTAAKIVARKPAVHKGAIVLKVKASKSVWKRGNVCATAVTSKGAYAGEACATSKAKKLRLTNLPKGTYKVTLNGTNTSVKIVVKKNKTTTKTVSRSTGTTIAGTARTAAGKALKKGYVAVFDANGTWLGNTRTSSKGKFSVPGATSGSYTVIVSGAKASDGAQVSKKVTVKKGKKAVTKVRLVKAAKITGKVTNSKGVGIAGVNVAISGSDGTWLQVQTNATGAYSAPGLVKGTYIVSAADPYQGGYYNSKTVKIKVATGKSKKSSTLTMAAG
ncbi:carboxypeptidase regulatory-like domain-containing protein [Sanguibacter sp. A247]|uniref:carboxypeptidase regulatory-like domain-containing protein n=1 Tax=unclassified Sanguibacter TaxID=2645534 RepID=UPI003FD6FDAD